MVQRNAGDLWLSNGASWGAARRGMGDCFSRRRGVNVRNGSNRNHTEFMEVSVFIAFLNKNEIYYPQFDPINEKILVTNSIDKGKVGDGQKESHECK